MKGRERNKIVTLHFVLLTVLFSLLLPIQITLASDQVVISFDPHPSEPPYAPINPDPPDGALDVGLPVTLSVDVYDMTEDPVDVYFYNALNDSLIGVDYNVPSDWSVASVVWSGLLKGQVYSWYAIARAHGYENKSETWIFYTEEPSSPPSSPPGGVTQPNQPPIANITGPIIGYVNETLVFHAYNSYDPDGNITGYRWDFENDGIFDTDWLEDVLITCNYPIPGNYTIILEVKDDDGANATASHNIQIIILEAPLQLPIPRVNGPYHGYTNESIMFSSNGSYDPDGTITNYTWYFGDGNKSYLENPVHSYAKSGNYTVLLKITDNDTLNNITTTKAIIIDREKPKKDKDERDLPLLFLLILIMAIIATIIVVVIRSKTYRFTVLVEKLDESKKNKYKNVEFVLDKNSDEDIKQELDKKTGNDLEQDLDNKVSEDVELELDKSISNNGEPKLDKNKDLDIKPVDDKDISKRINKLLSELNKKQE